MGGLTSGRSDKIETWKMDRRDFVMQDVIYLAVTILFFAIAFAYVVFCERVR